MLRVVCMPASSFLLKDLASVLHMKTKSSHAISPVTINVQLSSVLFFNLLTSTLLAAFSLEVTA
jgi:hypothetical protein